uniref:Uncharacterized protein n=1 Tax=Paramoeba aestuarina TaxID=180227 RepID=A0A7S4L6W9_9EUKA
MVGFSILGRDIKTKEKLSCSFFTQDVKAQALWMARIDNGVADKVDGELSYLGLSPDSKFDKIEYMKEGRIFYYTSSGKWLQRLLVLEKGTLSVNRVKGKQRLLKESVPLCCSSVRIAEVSSKENSFQVTAGSQILMFSAKSNEERYQWVNAIRHYIRLIISTKKEEALYQEKMKKDPNFIIKDLAKDQEECVDCGKKEISWANCSLGLFHCRQCGGIHRTLGYTPKLKTVGYGKWSMEEVEEFRRFTPEEIARWKTPEGVAKPSATDSHSAKFLFIEQKYGSLLKEEEPETDDTSTSTESSNPPKEDSGKKLEKGDKKSNSLGLTGLPDGGGSGGLKSERKEKKKKEKKKGK